MSKNFLVSDNHFGHKNIIDYANRPFEVSYKGVEANTEYMIEKWNSVVSKDDNVIHLGDFGLGWNSKKYKTKRDFYVDILYKLNGKKALLLGNHDRESKSFYINAGFDTVGTYLIQDNIMLNHYPLEINAEFMKPGLINHINKLKEIYNEKECIGLIHGHSHNFIYEDKRFYNVSVECNDYKPQDFEIIKSKFRKRNKNGTHQRIN